ncbi:MAG TPA: excinuclease ABC subunit UvrC [Ignavibacteria bacterium]|nr:excinuclease ABC subunit UvrC [Ignavibacteria bacterium]
MSEVLKNKIDALPASPGIYQFKDSTGKVLYIGKAKILRNRVRQYFQSRPHETRLDVMINKIADLEIIRTDNEVEALILELNLINKFKPRYNVNLKDDKSYPYIVITNEAFPRVFPTRQKRSDGSRYFGPYTDVKTMRSALKSIRDVFQIRSCSFNLTEETITANKYKVCLDYHIHKCEAPCVGYVSREDYNKMINQVAKLLNGKTTSLIKELNSEMESYANNMQFEKAAKLRDTINALEVYSSRQKMVDEDVIDRDIFAVAREEKEAVGMILKIREGKVIGKSHYALDNVEGKTDDEVIENLVTSYYEKSDFVPEEIYLEKEIEDIDVIEKWLKERKNSKVEIVVPKIGEKAKLVAMVRANAKYVLDEIKLAKMKKEFIPHSIEALKRDLRLTKLPRRIECYDISHIQGTDTVASMVVFIDGKPKKSDYRKFKIQTALNEVGRPDDFLSMREVIHRRFRRFVEDGHVKTDAEEEYQIMDVPADEKEKQQDVSFASMPDLIVIDGGKGQLSSAVKVLSDIGLETLNVIGLAKRLEEVYLPGHSDPQSIPHTSSGLKMLQRVRDEAHRFAVTYHRTLRDKNLFKSELEDIKGVGKKTMVKLLSEYGSVENIKEVIENNYETIEKFAGKKVAGNLKEYFNQVVKEEEEG